MQRDLELYNEIAKKYYPILLRIYNNLVSTLQAPLQEEKEPNYERFLQLEEKYNNICCDLCQKSPKKHEKFFVFREQTNGSNVFTKTYFCLNTNEMKEALQTGKNPYTNNPISNEILQEMRLILEMYVETLAYQPTSVLDYLLCLMEKRRITKFPKYEIRKIYIDRGFDKIGNHRTNNIRQLFIMLLDLFYEKFEKMDDAIVDGLVYNVVLFELPSKNYRDKYIYFLRVSELVLEKLDYTMFMPTPFRFACELVKIHNLKVNFDLISEETTRLMIREETMSFSPLEIAETVLYKYSENMSIYGENTLKCMSILYPLANPRSKKLTIERGSYELMCINKKIDSDIFDYDKNNKLGAGTYGTVFLAKKGDEMTAVKVTRNSKDFESSFLKEFNCPYIVSIYDIGVSPSGEMQFMMEKMDGSLNNYIRGVDLEMYHIGEIFSDVCKGVKYLHDRNVAHLDIKPENVLFKNKTFKLSDFSLSVFDYTTKPKSTGVCTLWWKPPELIISLYDVFDYDSKAVDIWSLGILLCNLIMEGRTPFYCKQGKPPQEAHDMIQEIFSAFKVPNVQKTYTKVAIPVPSVDRKSLLYYMLRPFSADPNKRDSITTKYNRVAQLLDGMLDVDPKERMTIDEVLKHSFVQNAR